MNIDEDFMHCDVCETATQIDNALHRGWLITVHDDKMIDLCSPPCVAEFFDRISFPYCVNND